MSNEIVLYQWRNDIAYVNRELATRRDHEAAKASSDIFRVSDLYVSRYGVLGYVELSLVGGRGPHVGGVIEVPGALVESMRVIPGMVGYISEVVFNQDHDFTVGREERLDHPSLEGIHLFDTKYYWYPKPETRLIYPSEVATEINSASEEVMRFMTNMDVVLDKFVPKERRTSFESLQIQGPGLLGQVETTQS